MSTEDTTSFVNTVAPAAIIAKDLPAYLIACQDQDLTPLLNRPNGWAEITAVDFSHSATGRLSVEVGIIDAAYGEQSQTIAATTVVQVAIYVGQGILS